MSIGQLPVNARAICPLTPSTRNGVLEPLGANFQAISNGVLDLYGETLDAFNGTFVGIVGAALDAALKVFLYPFKEVSKEVVGTRVLLTRSLFAGGILRRLLPRVSRAKSISAALRF